MKNSAMTVARPATTVLEYVPAIQVTCCGTAFTIIHVANHEAHLPRLFVQGPAQTSTVHNANCQRAFVFMTGASTRPLCKSLNALVLYAMRTQVYRWLLQECNPENQSTTAPRNIVTTLKIVVRACTTDPGSSTDAALLC